VSSTELAAAKVAAPTVIEANEVTKRFAAYHRRATSLKERFVRRAPTDREDFLALSNVSLRIARGESVGLIGANGSGKSTLLKVLAGILRPTTGTVQVHGRVASLLELGAGFDGELTGRENIYLNASLLGLSRAETDALFDEIVAFSELEDFIDSPVKHYSSGMYVRLGFSVAVHVDPEVLIIDEVLAVGDAAFQRKCIDRIKWFQDKGKTILFVSHSPDLVRRLCTRAVVLDHGVVAFDGDPRDAESALHEILGVDPVERTGHGPVRVEGLRVLDIWSGETKARFAAGSAVRVEAELLWLEPDAMSGEVVVELHLTSGDDDDPIVVVEPGRFAVTPLEGADGIGRTNIAWQINELPSVTGDFSVRLGVLERGEVVGTGRVGIRIRGAEVMVAHGLLTLEVDTVPVSAVYVED
jgi:ABC-2 type transport system ATP-binding protein